MYHKSPNLRDAIRFYQKHGCFPFPISGGDETTTTTPDPHANPGGNKGGEVKFKDQETFEALLSNRIEQAKRSWERDERPRIVEDVTKAVQDEIRVEAERKAKEESGEFKTLYEGLLNVNSLDGVPKESRLFGILQDIANQKTSIEATVKTLVEDELKTLPDAMKVLMPTEYDLSRQLEWIRNAKKAAGVQGKTKGASQIGRAHV